MQLYIVIHSVVDIDIFLLGNSKVRSVIARIISSPDDEGNNQSQNQDENYTSQNDQHNFGQMQTAGKLLILQIAEGDVLQVAGAETSIFTKEKESHI